MSVSFYVSRFPSSGSEEILCRACRDPRSAGFRFPPDKLPGSTLSAWILYAQILRPVSSFRAKYFSHYTRNRHFLAGGSREKTEIFQTFMIFLQKKTVSTPQYRLFLPFFQIRDPEWTSQEIFFPMLQDVRPRKLYFFFSACAA